MSTTTQWIVWIIIIIVGAGLITLFRYISYKSQVNKYNAGVEKLRQECRETAERSKAEALERIKKEKNEKR